MPREQKVGENALFEKQVKYYKDMLFTAAKDSFAGRFDYDTFHFHRNAWENALAESLVDSYCAAAKEEYIPEITELYIKKIKNQVRIFDENTKDLRQKEV